MQISEHTSDPVILRATVPDEIVASVLSRVDVVEPCRGRKRDPYGHEVTRSVRDML